MKKALLPLAFLCISTAHASNGLYFSAEGGVATQSGLPAQTDVNANDRKTDYAPNAIRIGAGYNHDLSKLFGIGVEIGGGRYAKTTYTYPHGPNTEVSARTVEFLAVGTFHLMPRFDLLTKIGGIRLTPHVEGQNAPEKNTEIPVEAVIGGLVPLTPAAALTLTYSHVLGSKLHSLADLNNKAQGLNEVLFGIRYTFGQR
jgi:hypothetical protein